MLIPYDFLTLDRDDFIAKYNGIGRRPEYARRLAYRTDQTEEATTIEVEVPGIRAEDIDITRDGDKLTIVAGEKSIHLVVNRAYDLSDAEATLELGILKLVAKRRPETRPTKVQIKVV